MVANLLDPTRLLFDLQRSNEIAQSFAGCLLPDEIAHSVTNGLVEKFDIAFARVWLVEPEQTVLRLVASSGLYTHIDGSFARVPMGAYKVGKIAQNRVSFLSNHLADEAWVKDREWAIANNIRGFAGYPLTVRDCVVGVLATFSHRAMPPEFLEVLQMLCTTASVSLDAALRYQKQTQPIAATSHPNLLDLSLSDQLANLLKSTRLTLIGTEQSLSAPLTYLFLQTGQVLNQLGCTYCRLLYSAATVTLEAIVPIPTPSLESQQPSQMTLATLKRMATYGGGMLQTQIGANQKVLQLSLQVPYLMDSVSLFSEREVDVMNLLAQGLRDRDIASQLHISESTVKFHMNNVLTKLKAKTRYQALHQAIIQGWV